jgi:hypothetical protein
MPDVTAHACTSPAVEPSIPDTRSTADLGNGSSLYASATKHNSSQPNAPSSHDLGQALGRYEPLDAPCSDGRTGRLLTTRRLLQDSLGL